MGKSNELEPEWRLVIEGDIDTIKNIIARGDVNKNLDESMDEDTSAITFLDYSDKKSIPLLLLLLENGANPDVHFLFDGKEVTPLSLAAINNNVEAMQLLLDHGASDLNQTLNQVVYHDDHGNLKDSVAFLLDHNADSNELVSDDKFVDLPFIEITQLLLRDKRYEDILPPAIHMDIHLYLSALINPDEPHNIIPFLDHGLDPNQLENFFDRNDPGITYDLTTIPLELSHILLEYGLQSNSVNPDALQSFKAKQKKYANIIDNFLHNYAIKREIGGAHRAFNKQKLYKLWEEWCDGFDVIGIHVLAKKLGISNKPIDQLCLQIHEKISRM